MIFKVWRRCHPSLKLSSCFYCTWDKLQTPYEAHEPCRSGACLSPPSPLPFSTSSSLSGSSVLEMAKLSFPRSALQHYFSAASCSSREALCFVSYSCNRFCLYTVTLKAGTFLRQSSRDLPLGGTLNRSFGGHRDTLVTKNVITQFLVYSSRTNAKETPFFSMERTAQERFLR